MAAKRRKWKENLLNKCKTENTPKKSKINIIEDKVFREHNGTLVLVKDLIKSPQNKYTTTCGEQLIENIPPTDQKNFSSPRPKRVDIKHLTPTFRKPDNYIEESGKLLENISPKSNIIDTSNTEDSVISTIIDMENTTLPSYSLSTLEKELNFEVNNSICFDKFESKTTIKTSKETNCISQSDSSNDQSTAIIKELSKSPDWSSHMICSVEVTIEAHHEKDNQNNHSLQNVSLTRKDTDLEKIKSQENVIDKSKPTIKFVNSTSIFDADQIELASESEEVIPEVVHTPEPKPNILRRSRRKLTFDKSYLDFADDDLDTVLFNEAFPSEESEISILQSSTSSSSDSAASKKKKNKKRRQKKKTKKDIYNLDTAHELSVKKTPSKTQEKNDNKKRKLLGESYTNTKGETIENRHINPNPCIDVVCGNNCGNISEERRKTLFKHFWGLASHQRRKDWISQCAIRCSTKRKHKDAANPRTQSFQYFINEGEGRRKVCQKFLLATLDVTQRFILYTLDNMVDGFAKEDKRGSAGGHNKTSEKVVEEATEFILSLPLLPSHHCRKDSNRLYLPEEFKNVTNVYRIYQDELSSKEDKKVMSYKVFTTWFKKSFNIGFHVPKKDKCATCFNGKSYDVKTEAEMNKYVSHVTEKEEAYNRFIFHQNINKIDKKTICACFDLQKVLNTPYGQNMNFYYSRKLAVYNLTIYESCSQLGICNVWTEADAKRGANEIATCLLEYITNVDKRGNVKQLVLYCDSAFGQNKNKTVLAMLRYALSICVHLENIQINYLIPGHTYMPVDSMHATIENYVKKSTVWAPSQWSTIIEFSRKNPAPYTVNVLNCRDFLGFEKIVENTFMKNQKLQISKISSVTFRNNLTDKIIVKHSLLPTAEPIEIDVMPLNSATPKVNLYPSKLAISKKKYNDLKKLVDKRVIPQRFAKEYIDLKSSTKVRDCLAETDQEDDE